MQEEKTIKDLKDHPLVSYFQSQEKEIPENEIKQQWSKLVEQQKHRPTKRRPLFTRIYIQTACAAAILASLIWGVSIYTKNNSSPAFEQAITLLEKHTVDTTQQVLLITQAQQRIEAGENAHISYSQSGKASVNQQHVEDAPQKVEYNQLIVPKGKSSYLVLADGTSLHVNAGTKLLYPSVFSEKYRQIYVDGEIYIDVTKNPDQPFIVKTPMFDIRVTGTAFNVNAYKTMKEAEVVLVRGSIYVKDLKNQETEVKPEELLKLENGSAISKRKVNAQEYIAWTKGHFPLQGRSIESILQRLSMYYGCQIACDDTVKHLTLEGTIDMTVPLLKVLERISRIHDIDILQTPEGYYLSTNSNTNP